MPTAVPRYSWDTDRCRVSLCGHTSACTCSWGHTDARVVHSLRACLPGTLLACVLPSQVHVGILARELGLPQSGNSLWHDPSPFLSLWSQ